MSSISFDTMIEEEFSSFEIIEMDIKGKLLVMINNLIKLNKWSQKETASFLSVSQPRVSNIKHLQHDKFSIEVLMMFADKLGCKISVSTTNSLNITVS